MKYRAPVIVGLFCSSLMAGGFVTPYGDISWPEMLSSIQNEVPIMGGFGIAGGGLIDNVFGIGGAFEFKYAGTHGERVSFVHQDSIAGTTETFRSGKSVRRTAFSTGIGIWINPLKKSTIRPVIHANFLPTLMALGNDYDTTDQTDTDILPPTGAYWGYNAMVGGDLHFMISKHVSIYGGAGYRFGAVRKRINYEFGQVRSEREYVREQFNGVAAQAGIQFW